MGSVEVRRMQKLKALEINGRKYCPNDKVRMRALEARTPRSKDKHQERKTVGYICPVCHFDEFDYKTLEELTDLE